MSLNRDPRCVFVGERCAAAEALAVTLTAQGIAAEVMDPMTLRGHEELTTLLPGHISANGVEVWVQNIADVERAKEMVARKEADDLARAAKTGSMAFDCEECGKQIIFPATLEGSVQECPHCLAYVDVPDTAAHAEVEEDYGAPEADDV